MSHYYGIRAKVMVREEFKDIIENIEDFSFFRNAKHLEDQILYLLKKWYDADEYVGCFEEKEWKYDRDTGIWEFEYYYNDKYYESANIILYCLLPYLIEEIFSVTLWDDWEGIWEGEVTYFENILQKGREELVQDIINKINERMSELT